MSAQITNMSKIKIKNFGPIKGGYQEQDEWLEIKKVTVFIGNQGSGKSTVAKLISTFTWIEKALVRGDYNIKWFERKNKLKSYLSYHRLDNYFRNDDTANTEIEYHGDAYHIKYANGSLKIKEAPSASYPLPQIMYVPAERNFIANVKTPKALKLTSDSLIEFVTEFDNAKNEMRGGALLLPINDVLVEYDKLNDVVNIKGHDYKLKLTDASSGFQSIVPLYIVSWFLSNSIKIQNEKSKQPMSSEELGRFKKGVADIWSNNILTDEQKRAALSVLSSKFNKTAFVNIVEEPEQNLYPISQWEILKRLLDFNNMNSGNKLIMTTHSPYIINYLTLSVKAYLVNNKIQQSNNKSELETKIRKIIPIESIVNPLDLIIYELDGQGNIIKLKDYKGLPSDDNYLNISLAETNDFYDELVEIEESI